mmetsp:Transcript_10515/g.43570  ORF Transcript_10515/g.43570 Transcript_10515/m.43570 type:complete len:263 (-) Transcript_10515:3191-3979(-)
MGGVLRHLLPPSRQARPAASPPRARQRPPPARLLRPHQRGGQSAGEAPGRGAALGVDPLRAAAAPLSAPPRGASRQGAPAQARARAPAGYVLPAAHVSARAKGGGDPGDADGEAARRKGPGERGGGAEGPGRGRRVRGDPRRRGPGQAGPSCGEGFGSSLGRGQRRFRGRQGGDGAPASQALTPGHRTRGAPLGVGRQVRVFPRGAPARGGLHAAAQVLQVSNGHHRGGAGELQEGAHGRLPRVLQRGYLHETCGFRRGVQG